MPRIAPALLLFSTLLLPTMLFAQVPAGPGDWPQWRGPNRDGIGLDKGLLKEWPEGGPAVVWQVETVGVGYSSLAIKDGRIFTQGDIDGVEHIICLSAVDGSVIWAVQPEPVAKALEKKVAEELKRLDVNSDGQIEEVEALTRLGWNFNKFDKPADAKETAKIASERTARLLASLDSDKDARLTFAEAGKTLGDNFARLDAEDKSADAMELAKSRTAAFLAALDKDEDSKLSRKECQGSALDRPFGQADKRDPTTNKGDELLTPDEIETYLAKHEIGKDGVLTRKELETYYSKNLAGGDGILTAAELRSFFGGLRDGQGDGPRGTPTVDGNKVYAEGGFGDLTCLDAATGRTLWHTNLQTNFGGGRPGWGFSESPLVEKNTLIVTPGGKGGTLLALDKSTGNPVWQSGGVTEGAHYSSAVAADIGGVRQIVQFASKNVFGVTADGGKLLWSYNGANNGTANCASPIVSGDHVFASSSYGVGGGLAKISAEGERQSAEEVYFEKKMANHHGGIVKVGDHMYGFGNGGLLCMNFMSGDIAWSDRSVGKGSLMVADNMLFLLGEGHEVALAEVNPEKYVEHGRFKIQSHGRPSWAHPVVVGGRFYIRNQHSLTCYDVRGK